MKKKVIAAICLLFICYLVYARLSGISGTVIDSETGKAIEGAVVLAEWTKTIGIGFTRTESYKVVEVLTDKNGKFKVRGAIDPHVEPHLTIYKKGYVAWNNEYIFPGYVRRTDFLWQNNYVFKLAPFQQGYSYDSHVDFINMAIGSTQAYEKKKEMRNAFDWENDLAMKERIKKGLSP